MKQILRLTLLLLVMNSCGNGKTSQESGELNSGVESGTPYSEVADFTIAFGSCNKQDLPQPLWEPILSHDPDVFIWGGDNIYADTEDMRKLENDYKIQKAIPHYRELVASTDILATWDDHDYGQNDGGVNWEYKDESQQKFLNFLNVPQDDKRRQRKGVYHSKLYSSDEGSVKIILLDTRYFRSDLKKSDVPGQRYDADTVGTVLGETQWKWLEKELTESKADFYILVSSIQILAAEHGFETWGNFPKEVDRLKELITASKAENVVLLSGDRHISEFSRTQIPGLEHPLIDFTSSGLTHTYSDFSGEPNQYRTGEVISELSFGLLFFDFQNKKVTMQMRGEGNILQQELIQVYE